MTDHAQDLPQLAIPCPVCDAQPGELCTSHSGTRVRRHDTHQARSTAWRRAVNDQAAEEGR